MNDKTISNHEDRNETLRVELSKTKQQLSVMEQRNKNLENERRDLREENDSLKSDRTQTGYLDLAEKFVQLVKQLDEQKRLFQEQTKSLKRQNESETLKQTIAKKDIELQELRTERNQLNDNLKNVQSKHINEMLAFETARIEELSKCEEKLHQLKVAKNETDELIKSYHLKWSATYNLTDEIRREFERKVENFDEQEIELLDLMQPQNSNRLSSRSDALNDSNLIINQTMSSNCSTSLISAKTQLNVPESMSNADASNAETDSNIIQRTKIDHLDSKGSYKRFTSGENCKRERICDKTVAATGSVIFGSCDDNKNSTIYSVE